MFQQAGQDQGFYTQNPHRKKEFITGVISPAMEIKKEMSSTEECDVA